MGLYDGVTAYLLRSLNDSIRIQNTGGNTNLEVNVPGGGSITVPTFDERDILALDSTQAVDAYAVLLSRSFTAAVPIIVDVQVTYAVAISPTSIASFAIFVDGVQRNAAESWINGLVAQQSGSVGWRETLAAGLHTVTTRWRNVGGAGAGILCRPVTNPNAESCSMRTQVLVTL